MVGYTYSVFHIDCIYPRSLTHTHLFTCTCNLSLSDAAHFLPLKSLLTNYLTKGDRLTMEPNCETWIWCIQSLQQLKQRVSLGISLGWIFARSVLSAGSSHRMLLAQTNSPAEHVLNLLFQALTEILYSSSQPEIILLKYYSARQTTTIHKTHLANLFF